MRREEIEKMEAGPELDALVAERVMGFKRFKQWQGVKGDYLVSNKTCMGWWCKDGSFTWHYFTKNCNYSTDISAAWQVVEKMLQNAQSNQFKEFRQTLRVMELHLYPASSASLYICLAALLAVEPRREEER